MYNDEFLEKIERKMTSINTIGKRHVTFLGRIMRKEDLENFALTVHVEGKRNSGNQSVIYQM